MNALRRIVYLFFVLSVLPLGSQIIAQQNFVSLKEGEYETRQAPDPTIEDAIISGAYDITGTTQRAELAGAHQGQQTRQEFELGFKSNLHDHIHLKATLANFSEFLDEQADGYQSDVLVEQGDSSSDTAMNLFFKEAYLQYEHNPNAILRVGTQKFNIGDKLGMVYTGYSSGVSQSCRVGTWCYMIGAVRYNRGLNDNLFYAQLTYPIFESGQTRYDPFEQEERQASALYVEIFRHMYRGGGIPLAQYGGRTGNGSEFHRTSGGQSVYFENKKFEYFGLNLTWNFHAYQLLGNYVGMYGGRDYWAGADGEASRAYLGSNHLSGNVWRFEQRYQIDPEWRADHIYLNGSGSKRLESGENYWDRDQTGYQEVQKGYYGDALVYFNGLGGTGNGHSVGNLAYQRLGFSFRHATRGWGVDLRFFSFRRNQPVFNENNETVSQIGNEFDFVYQYELDKNLTFKGAWGYFLADAAYSANDNLTPAAKNSTFSLFGAQVGYHF